MKYRTPLLLALGISILANSLAYGQSGRRRRPKRQASTDGVVAQAIAESKKTGQPIFAVSVAKTCTACAALRKTMETDERLKSTLSHYVYLQIDVTDADFPTWNRKYPRERNATPAWHVVSSRGRKVESGMGAPSGEELNQILLVSLEKTGRLPSAETVQKLVAAAKVAAAHLQSDRQQEALAAMVPVRDDFALFADSLMMVEGGQQVLQVAAKLAEYGEQEINSLAEQVASGGGWSTALALAQARQSLGMLPALDEKLKPLEKQFDSDKANKKLHRAATDLLRAEAMMVAGEQPKKAESALKKVITRYPNSEAATIAARLLTHGVSAKKTQVTRSKTQPKSDEDLREWTDRTGKYTIRASFVSTDGKQVRLKRSNGKIISVPISKLNAAGQQYLAELSQ